MAAGLGREVGALFIEDSGTRLAELEVALTKGDADAVAAIAHAIRGSAANVGADAVDRACAVLEALGRSGDLTRAHATFNVLTQALDQARGEIMSNAKKDAA